MSWLMVNYFNINNLLRNSAYCKLIHSLLFFPFCAAAQQMEEVKLVKAVNENRIDVFIGPGLFTVFYILTVLKNLFYFQFTMQETQLLPVDSQ